MRIVLVVDGEAEVTALRQMKPRLHESTGHDLIGPVLAAMHPQAHPARIARAATKAILNIGNKHVERAVVLLDREDRGECSGELAISIAELIQPRVPMLVLVVIKDRLFENWLVADVETLRAMPARFNVTEADIRSIAPNRADQANAYEILRSAAIQRSYQKVKDGCRILEVADVDRIAANSRSFRRFLRTLDYPAYRTQSRIPVE